METRDSSYDMFDLKCPSCGAPLEDDGDDSFTCEYCGSTIRVRRRDVDPDGATSICDGAGQPLLHARIPFGWRVTSAVKECGATGSAYPVSVRAELAGEHGEFIRYRSGEGFSDMDPVMRMGNPSGIAVNIRPFQTPAVYLDSLAMAYCANTPGQLSFVEQRPMPLIEPLNIAEGRQRMQALAQNEINMQSTSSMAFNLDDIFFDGCTRVYRVAGNGAALMMALATCVEGFKVTPSVGGMGMGGLNLGGLLGGLLGGKGSSRGQTAGGQQPFGQRNGYGVGKQVIEWKSRHLFLLQTPEDVFEQAYLTAFTDFCSTLRVDASVLSEAEARHNDDILRAQAATRANIDQQNRAFQSYQQAHAAQVAAFDSYNKAWWDRTNSSDAARRSSYQSRLASEDRTREKFSEATRGVNTYSRTDGSEVELSVGSDTAWQSDGGTVVGGSRGFDPGAGWTQLQRRY